MTVEWIMRKDLLLWQGAPPFHNCNFAKEEEEEQISCYHFGDSQVSPFVRNINTSASLPHFFCLSNL